MVVDGNIWQPPILNQQGSANTGTPFRFCNLKTALPCRVLRNEAHGTFAYFVTLCIEMFLFAFKIPKFVFSRGLISMGQGLIIGADGKEGWARPYKELIWGSPARGSDVAIVASRHTAR